MFQTKPKSKVSFQIFKQFCKQYYNIESDYNSPIKHIYSNVNMLFTDYAGMYFNGPLSGTSTNSFITHD